MSLELEEEIRILREELAWYDEQYDAATLAQRERDVHSFLDFLRQEAIKKPCGEMAPAWDLVERYRQHFSL